MLKPLDFYLNGDDETVYDREEFPSLGIRYMWLFKDPYGSETPISRGELPNIVWTNFDNKVTSCKYVARDGMLDRLNGPAHISDWPSRVKEEFAAYGRYFEMGEFFERAHQEGYINPIEIDNRDNFIITFKTI